MGKIRYTNNVDYHSPPPVDMSEYDDEEENTIFNQRNSNISGGEHVISGGMDDAIADNFNSVAEAAKETIRVRNFGYDFNTKNKSFLKLYRALAHLGVKNNKFFLKLYDGDLVGISPYSPLLTPELKLKIMVECIVNPWYYLREVCRIPEDGAPIEPGGGTQYRIDRNNAACWYLFLNALPFYQSKTRQSGKTQDCVTRLAYSYHYGAIASNFLFFTKDQELAKGNLARFKDQRDLLPDYMQMRLVENQDGSVSRGTNSATKLKNPITNNVVNIMPKALSRDHAMKLGRGSTAAFMWFDEFDFIPFIDTILDTSVFAYNTASKNAAKNGSLHIRQFSSTPGDPESRDGKAANAFLDKCAKWEDSFYDIPIEELKRIVNGPSYNGVFFVEHSWQQLGYSVEWYEQACRNVGYKEDVILREIELRRIAVLANSPFKKSDLMYLNSHMREPINQIDISKNLCPILFYEELDSRYPYLIGVDPSEGLGGDNNAFTVVDPYTQLPVAEFKSPYISQRDLFFMLCEFMDKYCPKSLVIVEANKGRELINYILNSKYRGQLYYDKDKLSSRIIDTTDEYGALKQQAHTRRAFGFDTTRKSRPKLFTLLETLVEEEKDKLYTQYLVKDILTLEVKGTARRIEASEGNHDDNIISYLMPLYVYYNATNLVEFGILRGARPPGESKSRNELDDLRSRLNNVYHTLPEELREMFDDVLNTRTEAQDSMDYRREIEYHQAMSDSHNGVPLKRGSIADYYDPYSEQAAMRNKVFSSVILQSNFSSNEPEFSAEDYVD